MVSNTLESFILEKLLNLGGDEEGSVVFLPGTALICPSWTGRHCSFASAEPAAKPGTLLPDTCGSLMMVVGGVT